MPFYSFIQKGISTWVEIPQIIYRHKYKSMKQKSITLDNKQNLFVIGFDAGCICLGFDVCQERSIAMAQWLGVEPPNSSYWGTINGYEKFKELIELCRFRFENTGEKCPSELTPQLIGFEGKRVEVVDKWNEKRRFIVGKSTGWIPIHIELKTSRSKGGQAVMGAPFKSIRVV